MAKRTHLNLSQYFYIFCLKWKSRMILITFLTWLMEKCLMGDAEWLSTMAGEPAGSCEAVATGVWRADTIWPRKRKRFNIWEAIGNGIKFVVEFNNICGEVRFLVLVLPSLLRISPHPVAMKVSQVSLTSPTQPLFKDICSALDGGKRYGGAGQEALVASPPPPPLPSVYRSSLKSRVLFIKNQREI